MHSTGPGGPHSPQCLATAGSTRHTVAEVAPPALAPASLGAAAHYESAHGSDTREPGRARLGVPCWSRVGFGERLRALVSAFRQGCGVIHVRMSVSGGVTEVLHRVGGTAGALAGTTLLWVLCLHHLGWPHLTLRCGWRCPHFIMRTPGSGDVNLLTQCHIHQKVVELNDLES